MLHFLKKKQEGSMAEPVETVERAPDADDPGYDMLGAIADDIIYAVEKKDKNVLKDVLAALIDHIKDMDKKQDEEMA